MKTMSRSHDTVLRNDCTPTSEQIVYPLGISILVHWIFRFYFMSYMYSDKYKKSPIAMSIVAAEDSFLQIVTKYVSCGKKRQKKYRKQNWKKFHGSISSSSCVVDFAMLRCWIIWFLGKNVVFAVKLYGVHKFTARNQIQFLRFWW